MRDYSKFEISVRGEPKFALFFLNLRDRQLKKRIDDALNALKEHPDSGDLVERPLWPDEYKKLGLDNLFRMEVGRSQRLTYTIRVEGSNLEVDVIEFLQDPQGIREAIPLLAELDASFEQLFQLGVVHRDPDDPLVLVDYLVKNAHS